ncbi:aminotransferase class V-fold PLP-dependent enzyme [Pseudoalteromonas fenneropenaei]|uniref:Aminotransferase class V-fold PLP-dependent enzyme n=1 Tax=Pseudoalteromonas fenneropenaei TaxID=1737459 RepID=A0ABV7CPP8_9GAMM
MGSHRDFHLPQGHYLLNHSVGRPLKSLAAHLQQHYFTPWCEGAVEPWGTWLQGVDDFRTQLAILFDSDARLFCPQTNLSSGLTKLLQSLPAGKLNILMSEADFPSMGFVMQHARDDIAQRFIAKTEDMSDPEVWLAHLDDSLDWVFVSQVYSNTGQQAPLAAICTRAKQLGIRVIVDVAQAAGVLPLSLLQLQPDALLGSSVKWLCGGPGAAYLWVCDALLAECQPKDVGWFSHANPFEFDIHHFAYHPDALRFWGGTPSVQSYISAAHAIAYFNQLGVAQVRAHNWQLLTDLHQALGDWVVSPREQNRASGTAIVNLPQGNQALLKALKAAQIAVDERALGIRISPHIYNSAADIAALVAVVNGQRA